MDTTHTADADLVYKLAELQHTLTYMSWNIKDERTHRELTAALAKVKDAHQAAKRAAGVSPDLLGS